MSKQIEEPRLGTAPPFELVWWDGVSWQKDGRTYGSLLDAKSAAMRSPHTKLRIRKARCCG